jgi:hypothetical protein
MKMCMASPLAMVLLAAAVQGTPAQEPAAAAPPLLLVSGQLDAAGALPWPALGLGDGGVRASKHGPLAHVLGAGEVRSPGGILLRAKPQGIRLDFPSGAQVMITPSLRVCLRGGEQTLPVLGRLVLAFADGSTLEVEGNGDPRQPIRRATLVQKNSRAVFWPAAQGNVIEAGHRAAVRPVANPLLVLGDGRAIYRAVPLGPLLGLRAILRPRDDARFPAARFVLAGDVLAASLRRLPAHVPPHPVQFPQAPEAAQRLADMAGVLFARGDIARAAHGKGPLVLALPQEWRLHVELGAARGFFTLGLARADATIPAVEWTVTPTRTELHLVRPAGSVNGSPRYFLRGLDLSADVRALWGGVASADDRAWAENELLRLGGRALRNRRAVQWEQR